MPALLNLGVTSLASYGQNPETGEDIKPKVSHYRPGEIEGMVREILKLSKEKHRNIYMPLAVMRPDLGPTAKGTEADIVAVLGLVGDFDDDDAARYKERSPIPASVVVESSAGRYQCFYLLDKPAAMTEAKIVGERLCVALACDFGTKDMSHVWRIPGTLNWPNRKKVNEGRSTEPQVVNIAEPWDFSWTPLNELDAVLPPLSGNKQPPREKQSSKAKPPTLFSAQGIGRIPRCDIPEWLMETIKREPEGGEDRSATAFGVFKGLQRCGYTVGEVAEIVAAHPGGVGQRYVEFMERLAPDIARAFKKPGGDVVLSPQDPARSATALLIDRFADAQGNRLLHHYNGELYVYRDGHYKVMEDQGIKKELWNYLQQAKQIKPTKRGNGRPTAQEDFAGEKGYKLVPFQPNRNRVADVFDALKATIHLPVEMAPPCWLDDQYKIPPKEIIPCKNGLLHLPTKQLHPSTPAFFDTGALRFDYDPDASKPVEWLKFLDSVWADDPQSVHTLQEVFGYLLTQDTRQQKIFMIVGPKRSGKSTIGRIIRELLGADNVAAPTLAGLTNDFGLAPLIGKQAAIIADARLGTRHVDHQAVAERLLSISGEDALTINRKYLPQWTERLHTRFVVMTNELPRLTDASGALASRFIILQMHISFYGKEDLGLFDRLKSELPGILNWSIEGWERLQERGYFLQPDSATEAIKELEALASPITVFVSEHCEIMPDGEVEKNHLYMEWQKWREDQGWEHSGTSATFGRDLKAAYPQISTAQLKRPDGSRYRVYRGLKIKSEFSPINKTDEDFFHDREQSGNRQGTGREQASETRIFQ